MIIVRAALALTLALGRATAAAGDENWDAQFTAANAPDALVGALAFSDTNLYVGGSFTHIGDRAVNYIARWDGQHWTPLGSGVMGSVWAIAIQGTNIFVGGSFTSAGGVPNTHGMARWDGENWYALGAGMSGTVRALAVIGTNVFAGGSFGNPGPRIARWDGTTWYPMGNGISAGAVYAMAVAGNNLFIGGDFDTVNSGTGYNYVARWSGTAWSRVGYYGAYGMNNPVLGMTAIGNVVYFGGDFTRAGSSSVNYLARWDGNNWSSVGGGLDYWVTALANDGTNLYVGGMFTNAGPAITNARCLARWNGTTWSPLGSGLDQYPNALAISGVDVYVGFNSTNAGGKTSRYIARWNASAAPVAPRLGILLSPTNNFAVSWPVAAGDWVLEHTNVLPSEAVAAWPVVPPPYQTNAGVVSVTFTNSPATESLFFRLRRP